MPPRLVEQQSSPIIHRKQRRKGMFKENSRQLTRKFLILALLTGCLIFLYAGREVRATGDDCCFREFDSCNAQCGSYCDWTGCHSDPVCENQCNSTLSDCQAPGGSCIGGQQQPQRPCQACLDDCDSGLQDCIASGLRTPMQCAYTFAFRCKSRCNLYCID